MYLVKRKGLDACDRGLNYPLGTLQFCLPLQLGGT